ncbi:follicular epithelium yolk protein subunit [Ramlibacter sp. WS9]|uniref:follicular epithelium yolk protein subunit n=1 Tax=Ramlibacter sp. WS9 TaxID=1882741 RepID=UPI00114420B4|nr:follicular epithelium yolk protein subunit [Ramlibacter sp. WS9]ROZ71518.1 follicular epithelium yolk protein subunit [Ramlibacter sp. WS9]
MAIDISIRAGLTADTSSVSASGSVQHVITDTEVNSFGLQDGNLKNAVGRYFGQNPNDAFLHSDTPWDDLYRTYGWPQVQTVLVVDSATVIGITSEPTIIAQQTFSNDSNVKGTFNVGISQQVANTSSSSWSETNTITVGQKFTYKVEFLGTGGGGETSLSYAHSWGETTGESTTITVGTQSGVSVPLDPGQAVQAQLTASRGTMRVRVVYKAYVTGSTAINYNPTFKDHHFWGLDIGSVMGAGGISNLLTFTEDIEIGFFTNSKIVLNDPSGQQLKTAFTAEAVHA